MNTSDSLRSSASTERSTSSDHWRLKCAALARNFQLFQRRFIFFSSKTLHEISFLHDCCGESQRGVESKPSEDNIITESRREEFYSATRQNSKALAFMCDCVSVKTWGWRERRAKSNNEPILLSIKQQARETDVVDVDFHRVVMRFISSGLPILRRLNDLNSLSSFVVTFYFTFFDVVYRLADHISLSFACHRVWVDIRIRVDLALIFSWKSDHNSHVVEQSQQRSLIMQSRIHVHHDVVMYKYNGT